MNPMILPIECYPETSIYCDVVFYCYYCLYCLLQFSDILCLFSIPFHVACAFVICLKYLLTHLLVCYMILRLKTHLKGMVQLGLFPLSSPLIHAYRFNYYLAQSTTKEMNRHSVNPAVYTKSSLSFVLNNSL